MSHISEHQTFTLTKPNNNHVHLIYEYSMLCSDIFDLKPSFQLKQLKKHT